MDNEVTLFQGDCMKFIPRIPAGLGGVDLLLVDPPYGIDYQSTMRTDKAQWKPKIKNDKTPYLEFIPECSQVLKPTGSALIFTRWDVQQTFIDALKRNGLQVRSVIIWDKQCHGMGDLKRAYGSRYESILFASNERFRFPGKRPQDIISCAKIPPQKLIHPNEKPVKLLEMLIEQTTNEGETVLDCCMGSGSTGVACVNTGRRFIGMELDEGYFQIAKERIEAARQNQTH